MTALPFAVRLGNDLVHVEDVARSIGAFGQRYLRRVYAPAELGTCWSAADGWSVDRLAARFAAKEAVIKALRPTGGVDHRSIEVRQAADGAPHVHLTGAIAARAAELGLADSSLSLSHDGAYATAVFLAVTAPDAPCSQHGHIQTLHPVEHQRNDQ